MVEGDVVHYLEDFEVTWSTSRRLPNAKFETYHRGLTNRFGSLLSLQDLISIPNRQQHRSVRQMPHRQTKMGFPQ
jgi:hypothetical protein